jgi:hypothetical protein
LASVLNRKCGSICACSSLQPRVECLLLELALLECEAQCIVLGLRIALPVQRAERHRRPESQRQQRDEKEAVHHPAVPDEGRPAAADQRKLQQQGSERPARTTASTWLTQRGTPGRGQYSPALNATCTNSATANNCHTSSRYGVKKIG